MKNVSQVRILSILCLCLFLLSNSFAQRKCLKGNCRNGYSVLQEGDYIFFGKFVKKKQIDGVVINITKQELYRGPFVDGKLEGKEVIVYRKTYPVYSPEKYLYAAEFPEKYLYDAEFKNGERVGNIVTVKLRGDNSNTRKILSGPVNDMGLLQGYGRVYHYEGKIKFGRCIKCNAASPS
ncbi:hypothetical protein [Runella sp.]|uniref:hypothetical protein n=1 Tax=Runella sp. TaxID=1960881 RepID=UPI00262EEAD0|nr:hypothetical protein [Runella sp.]